ncbi:MAG: zinc-binding dehydrogenase [Betaproteobacteria bacterium]|nr:zinc-binding dehydrogenase [Betaproteobacteria bacterium]
MTVQVPTTGLQLRSLVTKDGELQLSLARVAVEAPGADEVLLRVEGTPINPSDLGLLIGPADMNAARVSGKGEQTVVSAPVAPQFMRMMTARLDQSMAVGNEGAGVVVKAGASPAAQALLGKTVAMVGGSMYSQYRTAKAADVLQLHAGTSAAEGASCFVNPLTALGMVETMRRENHKALVHTAAASNLGQMLNRICLADGVGLVNIVRSGGQEKILRDAGAKIVLNSQAPGFMEALTRALAETGATIAFDAIGGGKLASQILSCMEAAANQTASGYSRYGSTTYKQVYIYGGLDTGPTELTRSFGMAWGVGGWLLTPFLMKTPPADVQRLRQRVANEIKTTFASHYTRTISLAEALQPDVINAYNKRATGEKFLINPNKDV